MQQGTGTGIQPIAGLAIYAQERQAAIDMKLAANTKPFLHPLITKKSPPNLFDPCGARFVVMVRNGHSADRDSLIPGRVLASACLMA